MTNSKWHLRIGVTSRCNFSCKYCNINNQTDGQKDLETNEILEIIQAAYNNGITRVHWTGGEPTIRDDIIQLMAGAKKIGIEKQIITTNGYRLWKIINDLIKNGLTRVIVSLDSVIRSQFEFLTGRNALRETLKSIKESVRKLPNVTKISCCTMKSTLPELKNFIKFAQDLNNNPKNKGNLVIKLNQFFPCNPQQLTCDGQEYWKGEFVSEEKIKETLGLIGKFTPISRDIVEGDNPSYQYYIFERIGVIIGILALFSWKYPCGRCHKIRVLPSGKLSICLNDPTMFNLLSENLEKKTEIIERAMLHREKLDKQLPSRNHYRAQLGEMRFGSIGNPIPMKYFYKMIEG